MTAKVEAVIAALRAVLNDAERRNDWRWKTATVNRWINQLPGAWTWRWRHLKLRGDIDREVLRVDAIAHLRATIAYLETNREAINANTWRWPFKRKKRALSEPIDAEFKVVETPSPRRGRQLARTKD